MLSTSMRLSSGAAVQDTSFCSTKRQLANVAQHHEGAKITWKGMLCGKNGLSIARRLASQYEPIVAA